MKKKDGMGGQTGHIYMYLLTKDIVLLGNVFSAEVNSIATRITLLVKAHSFSWGNLFMVA